MMLRIKRMKKKIFAVADGDNLEDGEDGYLSLVQGMLCVFSLHAVPTIIVCFTKIEHNRF